MASKRIAGITIELSTDTAKLTKGLDKVAKNFKSVGSAFTKNVTAPILAIGAASVAAFKQVDEGMDIIIQKTGATGEELEGMEDSFKNLASTIPADFNQIGEAIGEVNTRFGATGEVLEDVSGQFIKFAQLNGQDVTSAIDQTQKALSAYGKDVEYASEYLDIMNKVAQQTGVSVDSLQNGIISNAAAFQEMGLSLEQATIFMGDLEKSGANAETVLNGMRKALKNATKDGKPLTQALEELEDQIMNGTDSMDGLTLAYEVFGKSGDQIYSALKNGTISFKDLAEASLEAGGSVSDTFEATLDPIDRFQLAMQKLQLLGAEIGARLMEVLLPLFEKLGDFITNLLDKWESLSPGMQEAIIKIGLIVAAIGPLLSVIGTIVSTVSSVIAIGSKLSGVLTLLTGPIGIVVAAVAAAIAIGVLLYKNWDEIKAKAEEIWTAIKEFFVETWDAITTKVKETWETIKTTLSDVWNGIKETAQMVWDGIKLYFETVLSFWTNLFTNTWNGIKNTVLGVWEGIKTQAEIIWTALKMAVEDPIGALKYFLENTWENIKSTASSVWEGIKGVITAPIDAAVEVISGLIEKVKGFFPIKLSNVFSGFKLPHISYTMQEGFLGIKYPKFSVEWYKKAYENGMRFANPTVLQTPSGYKGFGDGNGAEWVVGENSLLSKIQRAVNGSQLNPAQIYEAVRQGASDATLNLYADGQKLTNTVNARNTMMLANTRRNQGAF